MIKDTQTIPNAGTECYALADKLFPINRSIMGAGTRLTLKYIQEIIPELNTFEIPSGTKVFDWTIPKEWVIRDAFIQNSNGEKIVNIEDNNLHLVSYSCPVNKTLTLKELKRNLYTRPDIPEAIPYITSYYDDTHWGFCLSHDQYLTLEEDNYKVVIDSNFIDGSLTYGEIIIPGKTKKEVFLSTYICHPSMANNELSGPVVLVQLAKWLKSIPDLYYTYRLVFVPEAIGSITYLSSHVNTLKENVIAGFNLTCLGDNLQYSYLPSRQENSLSDSIAKHVLTFSAPTFKSYTYLNRGSDERQYCSPGIDLPVATVMRSKYYEYREYHTSLDNMDFISAEGLQGGFDALRRCLTCIENNIIPNSTTPCEPQLGARNLYPLVSTNKSAYEVRTMMNILAYSDGTHDLLWIANKINLPMWELIDEIQIMNEHKLITTKRQ